MSIRLSMALAAGLAVFLVAWSAAVAQPVHVMQIVDEEVELQEVAYNGWIESASYGVNGSDTFEIGYTMLDVGEAVDFTLDYTAYQDGQPVATQVLYYSTSYLSSLLGCGGAGCTATTESQCESGYTHCIVAKVCPNGTCISSTATCGWKDSSCKCPIVSVDCGVGGSFARIELETCYGDVCSLTVTPVEMGGG